MNWLKFLIGLLTKKKPDIDWTNPHAKVSKYFTVGETLWLPTWQEYHMPSKSEKKNILKFAQTMDIIREFLGRPISVHVWTRPVVANIPGSKNNGKDYNALINGAPKSSHRFGRACDWHAIGMTCDAVRTKLKPKLKEFKIRMEDKQGSNWTHIDNKRVIFKRFFKP